MALLFRWRRIGLQREMGSKAIWHAALLTIYATQHSSPYGTSKHAIIANNG